MSVPIKLRKQLLEDLESLAESTNKDINYLVNQAVDEYLEKISDEYLLKIAEERLADLKAGKSKTIPFEEVKAKYGL